MHTTKKKYDKNGTIETSDLMIIIKRGIQIYPVDHVIFNGSVQLIQFRKGVQISYNCKGDKEGQISI